MLQLFNSLTRQREPLKTLEPGKVRLYVCGITVYDYCHLGHARFLVVFDMFVRYLRARGWQVRYVRNITDIDDKIIRRATESGTTPEAVAERFATALAEDEAALGLIAPDVEPRATDHIGPITDMIERLIERGAAYLGDNGEVYYDVSTFERYGALSGRRLDELRSGARIAVNEAKDDPLDFVLWKPAKPGEPSWDSPWGAGRPGWHIECSAMSTHCLGDSFDIHGGGLDLQFPHHENEIAQSEAATGQRYVGLWMHNGFVTVDDEKMSKSLGNFLTLRDVLEQYDAESVRYFVLATHYRSPLAYNAEAMDSAAAALARLYTTLRDAPADGDATAEINADYRARFLQAMDDDLNTPAAIAVLFDMAREANRAGEHDSDRRAALAAGLREFGAMIGLLQQDADAYLQAGGAGASNLTAETVESMLAQRRDARAARDFATADRIRDELTAAGIVLEDSVEGTKWRRG
ncbi:cysteine--tRNA ligase [Salinisphaera sp. RV14]|uniref:cysteine--tRNA ligase n=1 Tax=unclassified Salinisphaera TaxID=2649847 RepID=UPI003F8788C2